jgi:hypothetical protein
MSPWPCGFVSTVKSSSMAILPSMSSIAATFSCFSAVICATEVPSGAVMPAQLMQASPRETPRTCPGRMPKSPFRLSISSVAACVSSDVMITSGTSTSGALFTWALRRCTTVHRRVAAQACAVSVRVTTATHLQRENVADVQLQVAGARRRLARQPDLDATVAKTLADATSHEHHGALCTKPHNRGFDVARQCARHNGVAMVSQWCRTPAG